MNDTPLEMQRRWRSALLARSGAERLRMGSEMFDTARRLALAALGPNKTDLEVRAFLLRRTYGRELGAALVERIIESWESVGLGLFTPVLAPAQPPEPARLQGEQADEDN